MVSSQLHQTLGHWFLGAARELPWRGDNVSAWAVMVSEFMLQQTPVARVAPVFEQWIERWPTPEALAAEPSGEAVRAWGRLGYPRRALRLHACAVAIRDEHAGVVPHDVDTLRSLPGVGEYTAAAIAAFGYGVSVPVLDTNVRRVLARVLDGVEHPRPGITQPERRQAERALPEAGSPVSGPLWSIALMELGALVCTASSPNCDRCPIQQHCHWRAQGYPSYAGPPRRGQDYAGTDRQCRGRLLALLRDTSGPVSKAALDLIWDDAVQRERCLASLLDDGLAIRLDVDSYSLP